MEYAAIIAALTEKLSDTALNQEEPLYQLRMGNLLAVLARRYGICALSFTPQELLLARDEVVSVLEHFITESELLSSALDHWEISRKLQQEEERTPHDGHSRPIVD
jgi:hypothetical protein